MATKLAENVYWVGAVDWGIRHFHNHELSTKHGSSYNAYLIVDEKTVLVDTVRRPFVPEMTARIREIIDPARIDMIIINHSEPDHAAGLPEIEKLAPQAEIICSRKGVQSIGRFFPGERKLTPVKSGDRIGLGKTSLRFLEIPLLHWPDSMATFVEEPGILFSNDAFGQHFASAFRFDDEVDAAELEYEALKYYANILSPFGSLIAPAADKLEAFDPPVKMIAPSHGILWRKDPAGIIAKYRQWASQQPEPRAVILFATIWEGTRRMADALADGFADEGVDCRVLEMPASDRNDAIVDVFRSRTVLVGSPTVNANPLPDIMPILTEMKGLKLKNKIAASFGCHGWSGEATKIIQDALEKANFKIARDPLKVQWAPSPEDLEVCRKAGRELALQTR